MRRGINGDRARGVRVGASVTKMGFVFERRALTVIGIFAEQVGLEFSLGPRPDTGRPKGIADSRLQIGVSCFRLRDGTCTNHPKYDRQNEANSPEPE